MKRLTLGVLVVIASPAAASAAQDVAAGKTSFNKCMACHAIGAGAKNKVGPELNGPSARVATTNGKVLTREMKSKLSTGWKRSFL
jgi:cytochrome c